MTSTDIEWAEFSWNPVTGCTHISPGCDHCYARGMALRLKGRYGYPKDDPFRPGVEHPDKWLNPAQWRKPRIIFVCSMGDLFHPAVSFDLVDNVWAVAANEPRHTFIVLTKRPKRAQEYMKRFRQDKDAKDIVYVQGSNEMPMLLLDHDHPRWPLPNLWLGVTTEDQKRADERIPVLLQTPAAVRFVSVEPMLGPVDLEEWTLSCEGCGNRGSSSFTSPYVRGASYDPGDDLCNTACKGGDGPSLDWVICGGESGPKARPMHPYWVSQLRYECENYKVPFFFKSWGKWAPNYDTKQKRIIVYNDGRFCADTREAVRAEAKKMEGEHAIFNPTTMGRPENKAAGRILDGQEYSEFPKVADHA